MKECNQKGYVMVPRTLLHDAIQEHPEASGDKDAFLRVLLYVNYRPNVFCKNGMEHHCERGESLFSYEQWAGVLGWSRSRTRRFFQRLFDEGVAEIVPDTIVSHIRIPEYDAWLAAPAKKDRTAKPATDNGFKNFWDQYHEITLQDKRNVSKARKEWNKLSAGERIRAVENIENYYVHVDDVRFCLRAVNYLAYKAFDNEYEY